MAAGPDSATRGRPSSMRVVYRRRRAVAGLLLVALVSVTVGAVRGAGGERQSAGTAGGEASELPGGGTELFPARRIVSFYGAPQDEALGVLGVGAPADAARRLHRQAEPYATEDRPVLPALELIATIADAAPGPEGLYRTRQKGQVIRDYLEAARTEGALLVLDIQPGRSTFMREARVYRRFLDEPEVGLALDPEWRMGPNEVPGQTIGSVDAGEVNEVARYLSRIVEQGDLPEKLLLVHQFTPEMVRDRQDLEAAPGVALTLNADGFGSPQLKRERYHKLVRLDRGDSGFPVGLKLFYEEDSDLMRPGEVLGLEPPPDVVVYE